MKSPIKFQHILYCCISLLICCSCFVDSSCYSDADCPNSQLCSFSSGSEGNCVPPQCTKKSDCEPGFQCVDHICQAEVLFCPEGMKSVDNSFCIDIYETSRADATETDDGEDESKAVSTAGVLPWKVKDNATAQAACEAAGKTLCTEQQWGHACSGPEKTVYGYGNNYQSATCNGIDTFCACDSCSSEEICSFPYCYRECGASFHLMPTGSFPDCKNGYGVYDMNGNLWEHVLDGSDKNVRGGAYNCSDSAKLHQCSYIPGNWAPAARGFRCCSAGTLSAPDSISDSSEPESGL